MGALTCGAWVMGGGRTLFDQMQGLIDEAIKDVEVAEVGAVLHVGNGPLPEGAVKVGEAPTEYLEELLGPGQGDIVGHIEPHVVEPKAGMLARLADCKEMVEAVWYAILDAKEMAE